MSNATVIQNCWAEAASASTILFDLDGTLIDSRQAILDCWADALTITGMRGEVPLDGRLIGPTARDVAARLAGSCQKKHAALLYESFVRAYDDWGQDRCKPFEGVDRQLQLLASTGVELHVVTNKRAAPTHYILRTLGWRPLFGSVHCPDDFGEPFRDKSHMISDVIAQWSIDPKRSVYVGDTLQDQTAAIEHGLCFLPAWWGDAPYHFPVETTAAALLQE